MFQFFSRKDNADRLVGLSISDARVTLAQISRQRGEYTLEQCLHTELGNQQQVKSTLPRLVSEMKLDGARCNCLLAPRDYNLYLVEAPNVEASEMKAAVRWKIKDLIDIPLEEAVIDVFPMPEDAFQGRTEMLYVVAAAKSRVENLIELVKRADLDLVSIDIPELAMRNMSTQFANDDNGLAFMALSSTGSIINLTRRGELYLSRKINTSIAPDVMQTDEWEGVRDRLVLEIQRSLDYYESQMGQDPVSQLLIAPRPNDTAEMVASLDQAMAVNVGVLDFASQLESRPGISAQDKEACMTAIGAALRNDDVVTDS